MRQPKRNDNPWLTALVISGAGGLLATYILIGFFVGKWLTILFEGPQYWIAIGIISGLILGILNIILLIKRFLGEQDG